MEDEELLAGLDAMAADPGLLDGGGAITCGVCQSQIDPMSGAPLGPVTIDNVQAVQAAAAAEGGAADAMMGGTELDLSMPLPGEVV